MGNTEEKRAARGILVTTSWVSPESKTFAARNNRLTIIEGGELKHLLAERLDIEQCLKPVDVDDREGRTFPVIE